MVIVPPRSRAAAPGGFPVVAVAPPVAVAPQVGMVPNAYVAAAPAQPVAPGVAVAPGAPVPGAPVAVAPVAAPVVPAPAPPRPKPVAKPGDAHVNIASQPRCEVLVDGVPYQTLGIRVYMLYWVFFGLAASRISRT